MAWRKLGLIFNIRNYQSDWLKSHAMLPTPLLLDDRIRIYFTGRDKLGCSRISFVDLDRSDPTRTLYAHDRPLLDVGKLGTFDDSGTLATCTLQHEDSVYLYYTAYNRRVTVPYSNSIGLAISIDGGMTFERMFEGPIVDRTAVEPYFAISPWVVRQGDIWHLWYASGTGWIMLDGTPESLYEIKYASSIDGIKWQRKNQTCIAPLHPMEANARPSIIRQSDRYRMWFCYRGSNDYHDGSNSYRIGYAEAFADDPTKWLRNDSIAGILLGPEDYDRKMQAYPAVIDVDDRRYLFYNGNGFGAAGFCGAVWE
jgi:hypothetical protein